jgi:hypothetical protein
VEGVSEAVVDEQDEGSMEEFVAYLVNDMGYSRNECPGRCPYKRGEHAHLHSPGNPASIGTPPVDFIYWGDGASSRSDPTREPDCTSEVTGGVMSEAGGEMQGFEGRLFCGEDCANAWWYEWGTE